jgi:hypothetical protein
MRLTAAISIEFRRSIRVTISRDPVPGSCIGYIPLKVTAGAETDDDKEDAGLLQLWNNGIVRNPRITKVRLIVFIKEDIGIINVLIDSSIYAYLI